MSEEQTTADVNESPAAEATEQQAPDLTVTDLQALKSIIDVASL